MTGSGSQPETGPNTDPKTEPGTEPDEPVTGLPAPPPRALRTLVLLASGCLAGVGLLALTVHDRLPALDSHLHTFAITHRHGWVLSFARAVTHGGATNTIWPVLAVAALIFPRGRGPRRLLTSVAVAAVGGAAVGAGLLLNQAMHRVRPPVADWAAPAGGNSFPSGHTTAATIGAGILAWAICRHLPSPAGRAVVWVLAIGYAATVGWSRVWLGVHWPLDVAGGWLFGTGWLAAAAAVIAAAGRGSARALNTTPEPPGLNSPTRSLPE